MRHYYGERVDVRVKGVVLSVHSTQTTRDSLTVKTLGSVIQPFRFSSLPLTADCYLQRKGHTCLGEA